jgi:hypothetical protein
MNAENYSKTVTETGRALWYISPGRAEWRDEPLAPPTQGEARVHSLYSAFSRGTESLVFGGRVPASEHLRMRAPFQTGEFPYPVKYGYSTVGIVADGPADLLGRAVFALHPHQSAFTLDISALVPLPPAVLPKRALLSANMETALNGVWDAAVRPGSRVAIIGCGVLGALLGFLCAGIPGTYVTVVDVDPARESTALAMGARFAAPEAAPTGCDTVFHTSATAAGLATALAAAGAEADVIEMSWFGDREPPAPLGGAFHSQRLRIICSQVGQVSPAMRPRWTHRRRLEAAIGLLADERLGALLEPDIAADAIVEHLPTLLGPGGRGLCQPIAYS